jgi:hypothetical protein
MSRPELVSAEDGTHGSPMEKALAAHLSMRSVTPPRARSALPLRKPPALLHSSATTVPAGFIEELELETGTWILYSRVKEP